MGLTRKITSVFTAGAVDLHSDKERIARNTAKSARAIKAQNKLLKEQNRLTAAAAKQSKAAPVALLPEAPSYQLMNEKQQPAPSPEAVAPVGPPPGWYEDAEQPGMQRWYDGTAWTESGSRSPKKAA